MGVKSQISARDAQQAPDPPAGDDSDVSAVLERFPDDVDPFLQTYMTEPWKADADTIDQIMTGMITVGSLL